MKEINGLITLLLIIIPIGAAMRITACCICMANTEDQSSYKHRIKNVLIFVVFAESISGILHAILSYY